MAGYKPAPQNHSRRSLDAVFYGFPGLVEAEKLNTESEKKRFRPGIALLWIDLCFIVSGGKLSTIALP
jgi:hypothetical protein